MGLTESRIIIKKWRVGGAGVAINGGQREGGEKVGRVLERC